MPLRLPRNYSRPPSLRLSTTPVAAMPSPIRISSGTWRPVKGRPPDAFSAVTAAAPLPLPPFFFLVVPATLLVLPPEVVVASVPPVVVVPSVELVLVVVQTVDVLVEPSTVETTVEPGTVVTSVEPGTVLVTVEPGSVTVPVVPGIVVTSVLPGVVWVIVVPPIVIVVSDLGVTAGSCCRHGTVVVRVVSGPVVVVVTGGPVIVDVVFGSVTVVVVFGSVTVVLVFGSVTVEVVFGPVVVTVVFGNVVVRVVSVVWVVVLPVPQMSTWLIARVWPFWLVNGLNTVPSVAPLNVKVVSPPPLWSLPVLTMIVPVNGASAVHVALVWSPLNTNVRVAPPRTWTLVVSLSDGSLIRVSVVVVFGSVQGSGELSFSVPLMVGVARAKPEATPRTPAIAKNVTSPPRPRRSLMSPRRRIARSA